MTRNKSKGGGNGGGGARGGGARGAGAGKRKNAVPSAAKAFSLFTKQLSSNNSSKNNSTCVHTKKKLSVIKRDSIGLGRRSKFNPPIFQKNNGLDVSMRIQQTGQQRRQQVVASATSSRSKFQLRLPASSSESNPTIANNNSKQQSSTHLYKNMPWYEAFDSYYQHDSLDSATNAFETTATVALNHPHASNPQSSSALPTLFFPKQTLQQLSLELHAFAGYVRLQPCEHDARQCMITTISNMATSLFDTSAITATELQVFGSYATPQICTYNSDVDMALWGVVDLEELDDESHVYNNGTNHDDSYRNDHNDALSATSTAIQQTTSTIQDNTKEIKVQKWRTLLLELQDQQDEQMRKFTNETKDDATFSNDDCHRSLKVACTTTTKTQDTSSIRPLFVLDRDGYTCDDDEDEIPPNETVTTTTSLSSKIDLVDSSEEELVKDITKATQQGHATTVNDLSNANETVLLDDTDDDNSDDDDDSDVDTQDSADKLDGMLQKQHRRHSERDQKRYPEWENNKRKEESSSSSSCSEERTRKRPRMASRDAENNGFEVSYHSQRSINTTTTPPPLVVGPVGKTRALVVKALQSLKRSLHRNKMFVNIEIRRFARVPIVTMESRLGFEGDVAIGGHNGADTSQFAATLVGRFKSFAPVVLFLKILLNQQGLDKPFTGGLGSYKLYVMLCHHLEKHLALGGNDEPGEVLASFLYRFARHTSATSSNKVSSECTTTLTKDSTICCNCNNGLADLKPCHRLTDCVDLFSICWQRLSKRLSLSSLSKGNRNIPTCSYLGELVRQASIRLQRQESLERASNLNKYRENSNSTLHTSLSTITTAVPSFFSRRLSSTNRSSGRPHSADKKYETTPPSTVISKTRKQSKAMTIPKSPSRIELSHPKNHHDMSRMDANEEELLRGYGVRRSIHGTLIPRSRPDVVVGSKNTLTELFGRISKNRKNKKKQSRDLNLQLNAKDMMR